MAVAVFKLGAFAIIPDGDKVLLCHRRDMDLWNLPGGRVEAGESPWEAVLREVAEETGLTVSVGKLAGVYFKPEAGEIVFSFVCQPVSGMLTQATKPTNSSISASPSYPPTSRANKPSASATRWATLTAWP